MEGNVLKMTMRWDNWKYIFESEKDVEKFLSGGEEHWGKGQGNTNQGRQRYYQYISQLPENVNIVEVGFGQALDMTYLKKENLLNTRNYFGLDVTESFVKYANNTLKWLNAYKYDGIAIPFKDNYFDYCYVRHVLEHQPHYSTLLKEVFRVTKKEVFINLFIPPEDNDEDKIEFDGCFYHNLYSRAKLRKFIQDRGWSLKEEQLFKTTDSTDNIWILEHD